MGMSPGDVNNFDRNMQGVLETIPSFLFNFYSRCVKEGFNDEQSIIFTMRMLDVFLTTEVKEADNDRGQGDGNSSGEYKDTD